MAYLYRKIAGKKYEGNSYAIIPILEIWHRYNLMMMNLQIIRYMKWFHYGNSFFATPLGGGMIHEYTQL